MEKRLQRAIWSKYDQDYGLSTFNDAPETTAEMVRELAEFVGV